MATKVGMYLATHESVTVALGQRQENTVRVKNQSDCKIRYRALSKIINDFHISTIIMFQDVQWTALRSDQRLHIVFFVTDRVRFLSRIFSFLTHSYKVIRGTSLVDDLNKKPVTVKAGLNSHMHRYLQSSISTSSVNYYKYQTDYY